MYLTTDLKPSGDFTKVMNEVIFDQGLSHAEFRLWCRLLAIPKGADQVLVEVDDIAKQFGVSAAGFRKLRQGLKDKGYLVQERTRLVVTIPDQDFKPKEVKPTKEQQLREGLKETWNRFKPDTYTRLRSPMSLNQVDTLKLHAEHNKEADLDKFLTAVLSGCKAEDWWKDKNFKPENIFGTGTPKQNKFTNVEKLYRLSSSRKAKAALFDVNDDQCWIDWFHSKKATEYTKVERFSVEDRLEAFHHNQENPAAPDTIRVYQTPSGRPCLWTRDNEGRFTASALPTNA